MMKKLRKNILINLLRCLVIFLSLTISPIIYAQTNYPTIKSYNSNIVLESNGDLNVTEILNVFVDGNVIKHGIYRDFPTDYELIDGGSKHIDFQLLGTQLDGSETPNHLADINNGVRIYIGDPNIFLKSDWHTFTINYLVKHALGFFPDHDELYWNVTGNGWLFPIQETNATVTLPSTVANAITGITAYTGVYGAKGSAFTYNQLPNGIIQFKSTEPLNPGEGFSIVVGWKKGIITPPHFSLNDYLFSLLQYAKNMSNMILGGGTLLVFLYYLFGWLKFGRNPRVGSIFPEYEPPAGFSAAALRYMTDMGYDQKVFVAGLINMAIKGYLVIKQDGNEFTLSRVKHDNSILSAPEVTIADHLFVGGDDIILNQSNYLVFTDTIKAFKLELRKEFQDQYFQENSSYVFNGVVLSNIIIFLSLWINHQYHFSQFVYIGLLVLVALSIIKQLGDTLWHSYIFAMFANFFGLYVFMQLMGVPHGSSFIFSKADFYYCIILVILALINGIFYKLLKKMTIQGRQLMDHIAGFKMFLAATEKERVKFINPPTLTPELFDKYLPFAIALNLDENWSKQFATVLANATQAGQYHQPRWYIGSSNGPFNYANFSSHLSSSLTSAVSSATTPRSSGGSGFSGIGGFSGGGFGGGGGGGW